MERGLSIEHYIITVSELSFDNEAWLQMMLSHFLQDGEIDLSTVMANDVLCSWPLCWTVYDELSHFFDVLTCNMLRYSEIHGNKFRNTKLIKFQNWVRSDYCTS